MKHHTETAQSISPVMKKFDTMNLFIAGSRYRSVARWSLTALLMTVAPVFSQTTVWTDATGDWFTAAN